MKGNYGFVKSLPEGEHFLRLLPATDLPWFTTYRANDIANNHCGAVMVTNLALYYASLGADNLIVNDDIDKTFVAVHKVVGNGPVFNLGQKARKYFRQRGYDLSLRSAASYSALKSALNAGNPLGLILASTLFDWHWVLALGWAQYAEGDNYLYIIDGWNSSPRYYRIHRGSLWLQATSYSLDIFTTEI